MNKIIEDRLSIIKTATNLGFSNKSFLITGATGMIGKNLVYALKEITNNNKIIVLGKDLEDSTSTFSGYGLVCSSFELLDTLNDNIDYIIHLASPTNSSYLNLFPVETIDFIYSSTKKIMDFALKHNSKVLYISSMEVYGEINGDDIRLENDLGFISLKHTRNSYSEAKRLCELLSFSYAKEHNLDVYIARLAQTFGAGTPIDDPRVFGYFARCVKNNENIVLKTKGDSVGNYCYLSDTIRAFFYILSKGKRGETYNVVGDGCRSTIYNLAKIVVEEIADRKIDIEFSIDENNSFAKSTKLNMSNEELKKLGWESKYNIIDMFKRMLS